MHHSDGHIRGYRQLAAEYTAASRDFVDPGDQVLEAVEMRFTPYSGSGGESRIVLPRGAPSVQIEAQDDGFGLMWQTEVDAVAAVKAAMSLLPAPSDSDEALIVLKTDNRRRVATRLLMQEVFRASEPIQIVDFDVGTASVVWSETSSADGTERREMGFGDIYFHQRVAGALLTQTAVLQNEAQGAELLNHATQVLGDRFTDFR